MPATATLSKGNTSVEIPLIEEGGTPVFISDLGKPEVSIPESGGTYFPRAGDFYSGLQNITLSGRFIGSDAYTKARNLIDLLQEDIVDNNLILNTSLPEYDSDMRVVLGAGQDSALSVSYEPGRRNDVPIELSLTRVGRTESSLDTPRPVNTPTDTGNGPIELRAGGSTVEIQNDVAVERSTGRPRDVTRKDPSGEFPYHISKPKTINETISLSFVLADNPVSDLQAIGENIFRTQLGRDGIILDFNGIYGLGEFTVLPVGSAPFRQTRITGREGMSTVPTLDLLRVFSG